MKLNPFIPNCHYYALQLQTELNRPPLILVTDGRDSAVFHPARHILSNSCYDEMIDSLLENVIGQSVVIDMIEKKVSGKLEHEYEFTAIARKWQMDVHQVDAYFHVLLKGGMFIMQDNKQSFVAGISA